MRQGKNMRLDCGADLPLLDEQDESIHVSGDHNITCQQDETRQKADKDENKLSQEDIEFFL